MSSRDCGSRYASSSLLLWRPLTRDSRPATLTHMKAEIISVGTEILLGEIVDINASWIAARLPALGVDLYFKSVVGDNIDRIVDTLERALDRSDLVIMTGGLGPTDDDLTRESIAAALGEEMYIDEDMSRALEAFFKSRGLGFP